MVTKSLEITKPRLNIEDNYNDDFAEIHQTIFKRLSKKNILLKTRMKVI
jgi:hypothetical protein